MTTYDLYNILDILPNKMDYLENLFEIKIKSVSKTLTTQYITRYVEVEGKGEKTQIRKHTEQRFDIDYYVISDVVFWIEKSKIRAYKKVKNKEYVFYFVEEFKEFLKGE